MKTRWFALASLLVTPAIFAASRDADMRKAIAFERYKDIASARQARKEAVHPSVTYSNADRSANRSVDETTQGKPVKDPGPGHKQDR